MSHKVMQARTTLKREGMAPTRVFSTTLVPSILDGILRALKTLTDPNTGKPRVTIMLRRETFTIRNSSQHQALVK
uniref:Uncharacterized protein n=1 Tax=Anguilla anguilla TaxID=7936 RepID=A0A0E9PN56_ANGAN